MRRFELYRTIDETGVSGVGVIAEGVEFTQGRVVVTWLTGTQGTTLFDSIEDVLVVHGHAGKTAVEWIDAVAPSLTIPAVLGWSNADTGPVSMRLYALDDGPSPRWAKPHARVVEMPLMEAGVHEGARVTVELRGEGRVDPSPS